MTVVEVVIALGISMVGLLALIAAMPLSTSLIGQSNLKTTAAFLAQQRLERIKNAEWCAGCGNGGAAVDALGGAGSNGTQAVAVMGHPDRWPDEDYGTIVFPGAPNCAAGDRSGGCGFRREVRVTDCSIATCSAIPIGTATVRDVREVTVTVFFRPQSGVGTMSANVESVQLVTLITRRP
jgi:hypothetical protein